MNEKNYPMYYTLRKALNMVSDVDAIDINMAAIPGVTNTDVTDALIAMAEERKDVLALIDLPGGYVPATENTQTFTDRKGNVATTVSNCETRNFNTSYAATYYPWVQIVDAAANTRVWIPSTTIACGVLASSAARSELWFAPAGFNRGGLNNGSAGLRVTSVIDRLSADQRDDLYEVNINPIASFPAEGIVVFGQKTLQATPSALDRINVRRLMIFLKKRIQRIANNILFDPNTQVTWNRFINRVDPFLDSVKTRFGLSDYRIILDRSTTTADLIDRNIMYAKILLKPTRAIEFIALDFVITKSGVDFDI
jgi:phage tail sheath protein FI